VSDIDDIRRQMARIRHDLHEDISAAVGGAGKVIDWRTFIRNAPWVSTGLSFALGYFVVPRRKDRPTSGWLPGPQSFVGSRQRDEADDERPSRRGSSKAGFGPWSLLGLGFKIIGPIALSAGQAYASSWIESKLLGALAAVPESRGGPERRGPRPGPGPESGPEPEPESFPFQRRRF
jgi:hypothetical protein